jgi:predicted RNase H-like nuclease
VELLNLTFERKPSCNRGSNVKFAALVAGVDGCRAGWLCVLAEAESGVAREAFILPRLDALIARADLAMIAIDIPIGVPEMATAGGRSCDVALRRVLGGRQSSVFAVPARAALAEEDFGRASEAAFSHSEPPRKVSRQCFHLFPKIREIDALITPALQARVVECHPEGAFWAMNGGQPLAEPKKLKSQAYPPGLALRHLLLARSGFAPQFLAARRFPTSQAGEDDFLDACACAWTARRVLGGQAIRFPEGEQPADPRGLRMEIWA